MSSAGQEILVAQLLAQYPKAVTTHDATVLHLNDEERTVIVVDSDAHVYEATDVSDRVAM